MAPDRDARNSTEPSLGTHCHSRGQVIAPFFLVLKLSKLYVFGGHDGKQRLNDMHILDIATLEWFQPKLEPDAILPPPRAGHTGRL